MGLAVLPASTVEQYRQRFELHTLPLPAALGDVTTVVATLSAASWSQGLEVFMESLPEPAPWDAAPARRAG